MNWQEEGVLGLRGFNAFYWMKEKKVDKKTIVSEFVKVGKKRGKRGGLRNLEERLSAKFTGKKGSSKKKKQLKGTDMKKMHVKQKNTSSDAGGVKGEGKFNALGGGDHVRTCIYVKSNLIACMRSEALSRDCVAVEICHNSSDKSIVVSSLYVQNGKFPERMLKKVASTPWLRSQRVIMGVDANSRHMVWNAAKTNKRGEKFLEWLEGAGLVVINTQGHGPTWSRNHNGVLRESHIDVFLVSEAMRSEMEDWCIRDDLQEPCDHKIFSYRWKNSAVGMRQFVRMSNVAKLRRINRAKLGQIVMETVHK